MKDWKTEKALYAIHEISKKKHEVYPMLMTGNEVSKWCKTKEETYGYIKGCGGDKSYSCWAVLLEYV